MLNRILVPTGTNQTAVITAFALLLVAAALLVFLQSPAEAQGNDRATSNLALSSPNRGELVVTLDAPGNAPDDYRVTWKKSTAKWPSHRNENTIDGGNAFPTGTSHTVTGLEEGTAYQARVRARYHNSGGKVEQSGPWSDAVEITISATPSQDGDGDSNEGPSTSPPAKPAGLLTAASHDSVMLSWDNPDDDSITGYQVLRGPDADNLAVLADDTGDANTSYTDSSVAAQTTYLYAVRARNARGLGPQSDPVSVTTPAPPPAKPAGLLTAASHDSVLLSWTNPDDDSITGYQVLRGPDADNLAVLVDDTGDANTSYTDSSVAAQTTYVYAVRGRNARGLGPQSDPVTVTTLTPPSARALSGVNFTLDGQALDTTGTCNEDNIEDITDDCTINIDTRRVTFAVDGTLDSDDRLSVKIGRDISSVSTIADESDLRGTNQEETLTFLAGRNLLRLWGDEDGSSGGSEEHFYRVNVLPYWELNGDRLSKSDDCRSTTDRTAAQITDANCVVTQFGNTAELQFHNVLSEHFDVNVSLNGTEIISEPGNTELAGSFTVTLQDGDNLVGVRLASKGSADEAESFGSNTFYYKISATFLVSNLGQTRLNIARAMSSAEGVASKFTTGHHTPGYTVSKVRLSMSVQSASVSPVVSIYSDNSGEPDSSLVTLTNPASFNVSATAQTEIEFDAGDYQLDAATSYWVVLKKPSGSDEIYVDFTRSDSVDDGGAPGWSISNPSSYLASGAWMGLDGTMGVVLGVNGALVRLSDDATLSGLTVGGATLKPAFDSSVAEYRVELPEDSTSVTIEATATDGGAEIVIAPADSDLGTAGEQVNLLPGNNQVTISVTAEDGLARTSYELTVYRGPAAADSGGFAHISVGHQEACGLRVDGTVECFGKHDRGWGKTASQDGVFSQIVASRHHNCATRPDGSLRCWYEGETSFINASGRIVTSSGAMIEHQGAGDTFGMNSSWYQCRLNADGSALCTRDSRLTISNTRTGPFKAIAVAQYFACGLLETGSLECWGLKPGLLTGEADYDVPEPDWKYKYVAGFRYQVCAIKDAEDETDGTAICWAPSYADVRGPVPVTSTTVAWSNTRSGPFVMLSTAIGRISIRPIPSGSKQGNVCGVLENGTVDCWGDQPDFRSRTLVSLQDTLATLNAAPDEGVIKYTQVGVRRNLYVCGLREDKTIACWGEWPKALLNRMPAFESPWRSSADLLDLKLEGASLIESFSSKKTNYHAMVEHSVDAVTITPQLTNRLAFYSIASEQDAAIIDDTIDLAVGVNLITIRVTSADRSITRTYQVSITRAGS